jgi:hypothetical protein
MPDHCTSPAAVLAAMIAEHAASIQDDPPSDIPEITRVVLSLQLAVACLSKTIDRFGTHISEQSDLGHIRLSSDAPGDASVPLQVMYAKGALHRASLMSNELGRRLYEAMEHLGNVTDLPVTGCDTPR